MRKIFFWAAGILPLIGSVEARGQCAFTPTVTPANLIMCPNITDTLWTQTYDSYQWYKNGALIPGAVQQYLVVNAYDDAGSYFKVNATVGSCTEMSDSVMVDGWAFLPPYVMHSGTYSTDPLTGDIVLCPGVDTMILELNYTEAIKWFKNGAQITGADSQKLYVTEPGIYTAECAPSVCPLSVMPLGVNIAVGYIAGPVVTPDDLKLCVEATDTLHADVGTGFQWYKSNTVIPGATNQYLPISPAASSWYKVSASVLGCNLTSDSVWVEVVPPPAQPVITLQNGYLVAAPNLPGGHYQWYRNAAIISGADSVAYNPGSVAGAYTVTVEDSVSKCTNTSSSFNYTPTGIKEQELARNIKVYPSATKDVVYIEAPVPVSAALYSMEGKTVISAKETKSINISNLAEGIDILRLTDKEHHFIKAQKIIKLQ